MPNRVVTWDDFQEQFNKTNREINKTTEALEKMRGAFNSLSEAYQGLIDYCEEFRSRGLK